MSALARGSHATLVVAKTILALSFGLALGVVAYTFVYAKGLSYLSDDPATCKNCHVMNEQYDAWLKGSHRAVATCNDCHTPSDFVGKYATKASHGFWHSYYFTTGTFHDPIQTTPSSAEVTERACKACHTEMVDAIDTPHQSGVEMSCVRCHRNVGHLH
jgi:cytochrome c nitrite reductase small subunit